MEHVLVAIDFSAHGRVVLEQARKLAGAWTERSSPCCTSRRRTRISWDSRWGPRACAIPAPTSSISSGASCTAWPRSCARRGFPARAFLFAGPTAETILREAGRLPADFIVMGSHGRGALGNAFIGSVSRDVLRGAACPVVVVPARVAASDEE